MQTQIVLLQRTTLLQLCNISWSCLCGDGKTCQLGSKTEDEMVGWHHWLDGHEFEQAPELVMDREAWCAVIHGVAKSHIWLSDWTELNWRVKNRRWPQGQHIKCVCKGMYVSPLPKIPEAFLALQHPRKVSPSADLSLQHPNTSLAHCPQLCVFDVICRCEVWLRLQEPSFMGKQSSSLPAAAGLSSALLSEAGLSWRIYVSASTVPEAVSSQWSPWYVAVVCWGFQGQGFAGGSPGWFPSCLRLSSTFLHANHLENRSACWF